MNQKLSIFMTLSLICTKKNCFDLNIMHALGAVDIRIYLAPNKHGYSISARSYDFCPQLRKLDVLDLESLTKCQHSLFYDWKHDF